ncbi:MAG: polysaccharide biosynthesis tyrosine autokinase, partial [Mariniphaga sp.]|nr:polysaccharide biosynthesis tyrosine autokinase [Mariniphaga sp.]
MTQTEINSNNRNIVQPQDDDSIDLRKLIFKFLRNWYWFVLAVLITVGLAFLYNRYKTPVYEINASMLVEEGKSTSPLSGALGGPQQNIFQGLGGMNSMQNIYNQMVILNSTPIVSRTLDELDFELSYYAVGRVSVTEKYKEVPFQVIWDENHPQIIEGDFELTIFPDGKLQISINEKEAIVYNYFEDEVIRRIPDFSFSREVDAGSKLTLDYCSFTILLNEQFNADALNNFRFRFHSKNSLVKKYRDNLEVTMQDKETSILNLTLRDLNVKKGITFLNKLTEVYQLDNLEKKNENANRTIQFISSQLESISDSLNVSENRMESFQSEHQVLDISMQSQQLLEQMRDLDQERVALETQNKYYHYLREYITTSASQELETVIAPSAMGIQDPLLNSLILQLNELITEKSSQTSIRQNSQHPTILRLNAQIESVKNSLRENVNNIISQSDMALNNLNQRIRSFEAQVRRLPATERNYVNIERKYKLNNETYTFLLQKLSEAQIAKASNIPDSQMIEEPQMLGTGPVEPKTMMIYAIGLLLGLALPAGGIMLSDFFNTRIVSQDDIESITKFPIVGHVFQNQKEGKSRTLVLDKPNSPASEPYRAIRTKLNLITKGKPNPVIAVTSTFPKEGKSYNSINIASSFALMRKKTVLLDLDLRNSKLKEEFNLDSDLGVVNYIIGKANVDEITFKTKHPYLKLIPAGPIPPNPAEMLTDDKMLKLLGELKEKYDVIVIDSAPVGYVADLFHLHDIIDTNLFVVSHKYTHKMALKTALEEVSKHQLKGVGIIVNNIKLGKKNYSFSGGY